MISSVIMHIFTRVRNKLERTVRALARHKAARRLGITFQKPNYIFRGGLDPRSIVIDVGCAADPELAIFLVKRFGVRAFLVDPTRKHAPALSRLAAASCGRMTYVPLAVAGEDGTVMFTESLDNESGSILADHVNVLHDRTLSYPVESVTLGSLFQRIDITQADYVKLDLEGAEYQLLQQIPTQDLDLFKQLFVEFHHHATPSHTVENTRELVADLCSKGFRAFSIDDHNYLFFH
jgi:FkbM family methyltransferase